MSHELATSPGAGFRSCRPWRHGEIQAAFDQAVQEETERVGRGWEMSAGRESAMRVEPMIGMVVLTMGCAAGRPNPAPDLPANAYMVPVMTQATTPPRPARTVLVLSGGGANGAFAAG